MRASRVCALGYVIVVFVAVLNKMSGGFVVTPAEAAFVPFGEGASIVNNNAEEQFFVRLHGRDCIGPSVLVSVLGALHPRRENFDQAIASFSGSHDWVDQKIVGVVDSRRAVRLKFADAEADAHVLDDGRSFPVVRNAVSDKGLKPSYTLSVSLQSLYAKDKDIGSLDIRERLFGGVGGFLSGSRADHGGSSRFLGDGNGRLRVARLVSSIVEQPHGEDRQYAVEEDQQPIGQVIVPVAFLISFMGLLWAARAGGRIAGLFVGVVSLGWLGVIVYYGGLL
jgi:hypothetical protein